MPREQSQKTLQTSTKKDRTQQIRVEQPQKQEPKAAEWIEPCPEAKKPTRAKHGASGEMPLRRRVLLESRQVGNPAKMVHNGMPKIHSDKPRPTK